ncbi:DUF551 domain-containing protein [Morganella morganii]|nr:DUF551 domain-containing protein [Morganella morganii subsp. morganii]QWL90481.1 DUF551 domain-containing protein [Morganella morganii subsp. morganii]
MNTNMVRLRKDTAPTWPEFAADCRTRHRQKEMKMKWIKCSEKMPEESGRYLCYVEEVNCLGKSHYQWNCSWNGECFRDDALSGRVTHWMPLPQPPEE